MNKDDKLEQTISDFILAINKRSNSQRLVLENLCMKDDFEMDKLPANLKLVLEKLNGLNIKSNQRNLQFLCKKNYFQNKFYLKFVQIGEDINIGFDLTQYNEAREWNIINIDSGFVITKTLSSFLTNKVWAWIDRGREIWKEEIYK